MNQLPHNIEAEQAVLGNVLLSGDAEAIEGLKQFDFHKPVNGTIFQACQEVVENQEPIDPVTVTNRLKNQNKLDQVGGPAYIASLMDVIPQPSRVKSYCRILKDLAAKRKLITLGQSIPDMCLSGATSQEIIAEINQKIFELSEDQQTREAQLIGEIVGTVTEDILSRSHDGGLLGHSTGFDKLDRMTAGFQPSDLIILAGRPSMGKTALAGNVALNLAETGSPVLIFSLEMSRKSLVERMISDISGISGNALRAGIIDSARMNEAISRLEKLPITIDDTAGLSLAELRARAKRHAIKEGVGLIVVDYLQLMTCKAESREREIAKISAGLKALAKELNVPVLALSQLNRSLENRTDKRPQLSDLRDSGSIEQDADLVIFIYRDEVYHRSPENPTKGKAELIIAKQRNGQTGSIRLGFDAARTKFFNKP